MAEPTVSMSFNSVDTADETSAVWNDLTDVSDYALYFTGPDTTGTTKDPVTREASDKWAEEVWCGNYPTFGSGIQVSAYKMPNSAPQRAMIGSLLFETNPCSDKVELTAWCDFARTDVATCEMIAGTAGHASSWLKAKPTGFSGDISTHAPGTDWCSQATQKTVADDIANALEGDNYYVRWSHIPNADDRLYFTIACGLPNDANAGTTGHEPFLTVKYKWT